MDESFEILREISLKSPGNEISLFSKGRRDIIVSSERWAESLEEKGWEKVVSFRDGKRII